MTNPPRIQSRHGPLRQGRGRRRGDDDRREVQEHIPSVRVFRAVPLALVLLWVSALCLGLVLQMREARPTSTKPVPTVFDSAFKSFGALFVPIAWSIRMLLMLVIGPRSPLRAPGFSKTAAPPFASSVPSVSSSVSSSTSTRLAPLSLALLYSVHAALRAAFYKIHIYMLKTKTIADHIMSDHVLLSSCVLVGLLCELYVVLLDAGHHVESHVENRAAYESDVQIDRKGGKHGGNHVGKHRKRAFLLYAFGTLLTAVIIGLVLEAFVTARHFHNWSDTLASIGLGGVAFKWTAWRRLLRVR